MTVTWENAAEIVDKILRKAVTTASVERYDSKSDWLAEITFATTLATGSYLSWLQLRNEPWFSEPTRRRKLINELQYVITTVAAAPLKTADGWSMRRLLLDDKGGATALDLVKFEPSWRSIELLLDNLTAIADKLETRTRNPEDPAAFWAYRLAVAAAEAIVTIQETDSPRIKEQS